MLSDGRLSICSVAFTLANAEPQLGTCLTRVCRPTSLCLFMDFRCLEPCRGLLLCKAWQSCSTPMLVLHHPGTRSSGNPMGLSEISHFGTFQRVGGKVVILCSQLVGLRSFRSIQLAAASSQAGGFINKKFFHPSSIRNQERLWKALMNFSAGHSAS